MPNGRSTCQGRHHAFRRDLFAAHDHPVVVRGDRHLRVRLDDLFAGEVPEVRRARCRTPRWSTAPRPRSSGPSSRWSSWSCMAVPAARTLIKIEDASQHRAHHQGHRLPVEVAVRVPRCGRQLSSRRCRATATRRASWIRASIRSIRPELPAERRQPAGGAGGQEGAPAAHLAGRDPRLVGAGAGGQEGRHPGLHQRAVVPDHSRTRPASIAASAPSCAAATMASCPSSWTRRSPADFAAWLRAARSTRRPTESQLKFREYIHGPFRTRPPRTTPRPPRTRRRDSSAAGC